MASSLSARNTQEMLASKPPADATTARPLRILSLDGGGIRGLASLIILQNLMDRIKVKEGLKKQPLPCDYFDLIVGTSTGGLIALMLGRLRMSTHEAIVAYEVFARQVFGQPTGTFLQRLTSSGPRYSGRTLETAIRQIANDQTLEDPELPHPRCRVAVVAVQQCSATTPHLLRTYTTDESPYTCSIVEAARATSAATTYFPPATITIRTGQEITYLDGGLGFNNPARLAYDEAKQIWGKDRKIGCIVSIGTGISLQVDFQGTLFALPKKLVAMATNCNAVHVYMDTRFGGSKGRYYRFDPPAGLSSIGLDEWERLSDVRELAFNFVTSEKTKLVDCVTAITANSVISRPQSYQNLVALQETERRDSRDVVSGVGDMNLDRRDSSVTLVTARSPYDLRTVTELYKQEEELPKYMASDAINERVSLIIGDITKIRADMIVNATNPSLNGRTGVSGAIHTAAGPRLQAACLRLNGCEVGEAKVTDSYGLPSNFIAHTAGPRFGPEYEEYCALELAGCYRNCLKLCVDKSQTSIAFPCISAGLLGYPLEKQAHVAFKTVRKALEDPAFSKITRVIFCQYNKEQYAAYLRNIPVYFPNPGSYAAENS